MDTDLVITVLAMVIPGAIVAGVTFVVAHGWITKSRLSQTYSFATLAVTAAEEVFGKDSGLGDEKFEYAVEQLLAHAHVSKDEADLLIQAAVKGLRNSGVK